MVKHEIFRLHLRRSCDHATHGSTVYILNIWIWVGQFFSLEFDMSRLSMDVQCFLRIFGNISLRRSHAQCVFPQNLFHHRPAAKCKDCHDQATMWRTHEQFSHACTNLHTLCTTFSQLHKTFISAQYQHQFFSLSLQSNVFSPCNRGQCSNIGVL